MLYLRVNVWAPDCYSSGVSNAGFGDIRRPLGSGELSSRHRKNFSGGWMQRKNSGFSLLELLIVVAIILIIATIAIPSLLRSRQAANESAAVAQVRTITTAEVTYLSSSGGNYGTILQLVSAGLLDSGFNATKGGYNYSVVTTGLDYTITT